MVQIVNVGQRQARIIGVGWKTRRMWRRSFHTQVVWDQGSWDVPCKIEPTDYATFFINPGRMELSGWMKAFAKEVLKRPLFRSRPYVRLFVRTSLDETFTRRVPREIYKQMVTGLTP